MIFKPFLQRVLCVVVLPLPLRIAILLIIALAYALFDVLNKRNVPNAFAYAALAVGAVVTLTYPLAVIYISVIVAAAVAVLGYAVYRAGLMGAGDFFEFVTISLILPIQPAAVLSGIPQLNFPFVFSVLIASGYAAVIGMVVYYLASAARSGGLGKYKADKKRAYAGLAIIVAYLALLLVLGWLTGFRIAAAFVIILIAAASALTIFFEGVINKEMVSYIYPNELSEGDMIATNLMKKGELAFFKKRAGGFGRLATKKLIGEIKGVKKRMPVYTQGVPLALFVLIGVVASLLFGNLLLYLIL